ncbi:NAD(P)H-binding protein [Paenibacillus sp. 481]|uniref:NAD(P)H-binding protein n=1 Tax=Paenibacillus sp. 481 TaxID=2835869 RepID=UPI001E30C10F|nr:NAD(P)H-binding protein [Paenibacillus sp. 481]UHA74589.1 NAD(P)H-binding protein [Paenibacillus sp. 481]
MKLEREIKHSERTAVVIGATGLIGRELVKLLAAEQSYARVVALVRKLPEQGEAAWFEHPKLEWRVVNFNRLHEAEPMMADVDDLFCCLGTSIRVAKSREMFRRVDYEYPLAAARAALRAGAARMFVVTALGADAKSRIFYSRTKGELEDALQELPFSALYLFRPSLLLGDRSERRLGEMAGAIVMRALDPIMARGRLKRYRAITGLTVAQGIVAATRQEARVVHVVPSDKIEEWAALT